MYKCRSFLSKVSASKTSANLIPVRWCPLEGIPKAAQSPRRHVLVKPNRPQDWTHCSLCRIRRTDAAAGGADLARTKLDLFETVDGDVEIQVDGDTVRDKDAVMDILEALLFQYCQLGEEGGHVEDNSRADEVDLAVLSYQTAREQVKAVGAGLAHGVGRQALGSHTRRKRPWP